MANGDKQVDESETRSSQVGAAPIWIGTISFLGLLVIAASSESVNLWQTPDASTPTPQAPPTVGTVPVPPLASEPVHSAVRLVGFVGLLILVLMMLLLLKSVLGRSSLGARLKRRIGWASMEATTVDPLLEATAHDAYGELGGAREALLDGDARNGIVACWMRMERGALNAGLPRWAAETAEEYSRRVVGSSSVEPQSITELAELYREARFSGHRLDEEHRQRAVAALGRIGDGLAMRETTAS
jgi:Domain of unknown function (DUF4129)